MPHVLFFKGHLKNIGEKSVQLYSVFFPTRRQDELKPADGEDGL